MTQILQAVGGGRAANDPFDVAVVQKLLLSAAFHLARPALNPGLTNGIPTPATTAAIVAFQRDVMGTPRPDGRIDPNGPTWRRLLREAKAIDPNPDPEMAARVAAFDGLSGTDFDDAYLNATSTSRERAVALFTSQAESWGDPDLKAWAERWLPSLKQQLARTQELRMTPSAANPPPRR